MAIELKYPLIKKYKNPSTLEMEIKIAEYFGSRQNLIIPNVSWGFNIHECDLLIMTPAGYLYEVEIKISLADLKKDRFKNHKHYSDKIKMLYFAIPEKLYQNINYIPERSGILVLKENGIIECRRNPEIKKNAISLNIYKKFELARLGSLRIWTLKRGLLYAKQTIR